MVTVLVSVCPTATLPNPSDAVTVIEVVGIAVGVAVTVGVAAEAPAVVKPRTSAAAIVQLRRRASTPLGSYVPQTWQGSLAQGADQGWLPLSLVKFVRLPEGSVMSIGVPSEK